MSLILKASRSVQSGFGLVELMIGLLVGMIVVGAATSILTTTLTSSNDNIKMARLDQELRQVMTMVSRDLRRATAWDGAMDVARISLADPLTLSANSGTVQVTSSKGNLDSIGDKANGGKLVFYDGTTLYTGAISTYTAVGEILNVTITTAWPASTAVLDGVSKGSWTILGPQPSITQSGNCMLFAYDTNANGVISPTGPMEFFGYRHISTTSEKVVKIKEENDADCSSSTDGWYNLTDEDTVEIVDFIITDNSPDPVTNYGFNVGVREYKILIKGRLKSDTSVERTLTETIRVRNDKLGT